MQPQSPAPLAWQISWGAYHRLIERLAVQVDQSGWSFDAIVCVARGGLRVGDVLSRLFRRPLGVLFASSYRAQGGTQPGAWQCSEHLSSALPLPGPHWLLVDDLIDSGATLQTLAQLLPQRYPQAQVCRTAVLWTKEGAGMRADYCVEHVIGRPWIEQPFECYDRMTLHDLAREVTP